MSTVVTTANGEKQDVETQDVGEVEGDGDGTALTGVVWGLVVDSLRGLVGSAVGVVLGSVYTVSVCEHLAHVGVSLTSAQFNPHNTEATHDPWFTTVSQNNLELVLRAKLLELLLNVLDNKISDVLDGEVGNETDGKFALDRGGDDRLRSWGGWSQVHSAMSTPEDSQKAPSTPCIDRLGLRMRPMSWCKFMSMYYCQYQDRPC